MRATDERMQRPRPRRQRALRALGTMRGFGLPRWRTTLHLTIDGGIDVADERGLICKSLDIEMRIAANPHVSNIDVTIDSIGGDVQGAMRIYHALRAHPATVTTTARGYCCSSATVVLLAGAWRECEPGTKLQLHSVAIKPSNRRWTAKTHEWAAKRCAATDAMLLDLYAQRTGAAKALFEREMKGEGYTSIDRACDLGLIYCRSGEAIWHGGRRYAWPPAA
jgi:ATP-dependent protease ClpP protease subunit